MKLRFTGIVSDLTRERFRRFRRIKRAYYSLLILGVLFILSLFCPFFVNDKPYLLVYQGKTHFPVLKFYPDEAFGGKYKTEADYLKLRADPDFINRGGWMIMPLVSHDPLHIYLDQEGEPPYPPSARHWLGTDGTARDIMARLIYGFRICMIFALLLMLISAILGVVIGGVQGYLGGIWDISIQRMIEIWSALPFLYVVILLGSIYKRNFLLLLIVMSVFSWIGMSYYMRGEFLKLKNFTFVKSARALGLSPYRIFFKHIFPNSLTPVVTILPFILIGGISALTSLDFLGFGLPPPTPSWGEMLRDGLGHLEAPWIAISATAALFSTLLMATFIGEGVREAFDPKSESRVE